MSVKRVSRPAKSLPFLNERIGTMKELSVVFSVASAFASVAAAGLWYKASTSPLPPLPHGEVIKPSDVEAEYFALVRTATLNRWAAVATALAAFSGAVSIAASLF
jgi:hypothetical protein